MCLFCGTIIKFGLAALGIVVGCILIGMGIGYTSVNPQLADMIAKAGVPQPTLAILTLGIIILILSCLSIVSAIKSNRLFKLIYCGILALLAAFFIIVAILVFTQRNTFLTKAGEMYDKMWDDRDKVHYQSAITEVNKKFHCCGKYSFIDYGDQIPPSCCEKPTGDKCLPQDIYKNGCRREVITYASTKADWIGYMSIVAAVVLAILLVNSFL